jgi:DNA-binding NtrC family response regulator
MEKQLKIMIVDDETIVGKRLKQALTKHGIDVEIYENSSQALDRLSENSFDIVVTDVRMDEVDGIELLEYIKAHSKRTKVIIITGYASVETAQEALAKGAFDFIAKPFKPDDLRSVVNKAALALGFSNITKI